MNRSNSGWAFVAAFLLAAAGLWYFLTNRTPSEQNAAPEAAAERQSRPLTKNANSHAPAKVARELTPAASAISGSLSLLPGAIAGKVVGSDGRTPEELKVEVRREPLLARPQDIKSYPVEVRPDGVFRADDLPAGWDYVVEVRAAKYSAAERRGLEVKASELTDLGMIVLSAGGSLQVKVLDSGGGPVNGCEIAVVAASRVESVEDLFRRYEAKGKTGSDGTARFDSLSQGARMIAARAEGHPVALEKIFWIEDGKLKELVLKLQSGLEVAGRVTDVLDRPLKDATVTGTEEVANYNAVVTTKTDANGRYVLRGLAARSYKIRAEAEGHAPDERKNVTPGDQAVDMVLESAGGIEGTAEFTSGKPVPTFSVRLYTLQGEITGEASGFTEGKFSIHDVPPGRYKLEAVSPEAAPGFVDEVMVWPGKATQGVRIILKDGVTISGEVSDSQGNLIAGARVVMRLPPREVAELHNNNPQFDDGHGHDSGRRRNRGLRPTSTTFTDDKGHFSFDHVDSDGPYQFEAMHPDYPSVGKSTKDKKVRLEFPMPGEIAGRVLRMGKPVPGQTVAAYGATYMSGELQRRVISDEKGEFVIKNLGEGEYSVYLMSITNLGEFGAVDNRDMAMVPVTMGMRTYIDLNMTQPEGGVRLMCWVHDALGPVAGAMVLAYGNKNRSDRLSFEGRCMTDPNGTCHIEDAPPGEVTMVVRINGPADAPAVSKVIRVAPGESQSVELMLPGARLMGLVTAAGGGEPVAGARVAATFLSNSESMNLTGQNYMSQTDVNGRFEFNHLPSGIYRVSAVKAGFAAGAAESIKLEGAGRLGNAPVRIEMQPGKWLDLYMLDQARKPVRGAWFEVAHADGRRIDEFTSVTWVTDETGHVALDVLPATEVVITAHREGYLDSKVLVPPGAGRVRLEGTMERQMDATGGKP